MDWLPRIVAWLSDHEATISAVVGIIVIAGVLFAGIRALHLRGATETLKKALTGPGRRTILITAGAGALLIVAGIAAWWILADEPVMEVTSKDDPLLALPTGPVVAVLPFENLSRDPDQEFFSDGLTDGIITALSRFKDLFVIARNSTLRYKGQAVDVRQLRHDLGARYVVEGSVQKAGDTLRITAQLLDAKDGTHLWADTYDRDLSTSNIFAVQDEITEQVVGTIAGLYGVISRDQVSEVKEKPTESLAAYECVLRTIAYYRDRTSATEHEKLRRCLERAVKSDPGYANAWAALSFIYFDEHRNNYNPRPGSLDRALDAARRAVDTGPTMQFPHSALASVHFYRHDLDAFYAEAERTIALNPNNSARLAHLGGLMLNAGDERGIALVRKAAKLDPFHPTWFNFHFSFYHFERGEYEEALVAARKINNPGFFWTPVHLAVIYAELGRQSEAQSALDQLLELYPGFTIEKYVEEARKLNNPDDTIHRWAEALRKAGLPE